MTRLRNQAELRNRALPLALVLHVLLLLVGRAPSPSAVGVVTPVGAEFDRRATDRVIAFPEPDRDDRRSCTAECDEDDDYHSPLSRFQNGYRDAGQSLGSCAQDFVFQSLDGNSVCCRGPPSA